MRYLILIGYEFLTVFLPFIITFAVLAKHGRRNGQRTSLRRFLLLCVFAVYVSAAFFFTGAGTLFDLLRYGQEIHSDQLNLLPFSNEINVRQYILNIFLFVPFGFLLPLSWPRTGKLRYALLAGLSFSLLIELSQLCNQRATDVDDLLMNTAGALLGYLLYALPAHFMKRKHGRPEYARYEPFVYIGAMFFGHFLLYNWLGMVGILYGN